MNDNGAVVLERSQLVDDVSPRAARPDRDDRHGDRHGDRSDLPPSWMLIRLALETRELHRQADSDRLAVMEATTPADYRAFLARVLGFELAMEAALASVDELAGVAAWCAKAALARRDLRALGIDDAAIEALPRCSIPQLRSATAAFGWLFVNERLVLLSGLVRRHLEQLFPVEMAEASAYFHAYAETPGAHLRELGALLGEHASRKATAPMEMVAAAREAFRVQSQWYARRARFRYRTITLPP